MLSSLSAETTYPVARNDLNSFRLLPMVFDRTRVVKELKILVSVVQSRPCPPFFQTLRHQRFLRQFRNVPKVSPSQAHSSVLGQLLRHLQHSVALLGARDAQPAD